MTWERTRLSPGIYHVWEMDDRDQCLVRAVKLRFDELGREDRLSLLMLPDHVDTERRDPGQVAFPETLDLEKVRDFFGYRSTREVFDGLFHERLRGMNQPVFDAMRRRYLRDEGSAAWRRIRSEGRRRDACDGWGLEWLRPGMQVWIQAPVTREGLELTVDRRGAARSVEHSVESGGYASLLRQLDELRYHADRLARATRGHREVTARNAQELQAMKMVQALLEYLLDHRPADVSAADVQQVRDLKRLVDACVDEAEPLLLAEPPETPYRQMHGLTHAASEILRLLSDSRFRRGVERLVEQARPFERDVDRPAELREVLRQTSAAMAYSLRVLLESPAREQVQRALDVHIKPMFGALARAAGTTFTPEAQAAVRAWDHVDPTLREAYLSGQSPDPLFDRPGDSIVVRVMGLADGSENVLSAALGIFERALPALTEALIHYRWSVERMGRLGGLAFRALCALGRVTPAQLVSLIRARTPTQIHQAVERIEWGWLGEALPVKAFSSALCAISLLSSLHDLSTAEGQRATARALENVFGSAGEFLGSVCEVTETILERRGIIGEGAGLAGRAAELSLRVGRGVLVGAAMIIQARAAAEEMSARDDEGDNLGVFYSGVRMGASLMSVAGALIALVPVLSPVGKALELAGVALEVTASLADWVTRELRGGTHEVLAKYVNHFGRYAGYEAGAEGTNGPYYHLVPSARRDRRVRAFCDAFERVNGLEETPGAAGVSTTFQDGHWGVSLWTPTLVEADLAPLFDAYFTAEDLQKVFDSGTTASWGRRIGAHFHGGSAPDLVMAE